MENKQQLRTSMAARTGEGDPARLTNIIPKPDGTFDFTVDFSTIDVPSPEFTADGIAVLQGLGTKRLLFGQSKAFGPGLRGLLEIQMVDGAFKHFASSLAHAPRYANAPAAMALVEEPDQSISMIAAYCAIALSQYVCTMDFYFTSAFAQHDLNEKSEAVLVKGVARVNLAPALFPTLIREIDRAIATGAQE